MTTLAKSAEDARRVLATMWTIRRFEEAVDELFARGLLYGTMHLSIGQEASATGACLALRDDDVITSTHRGHGHCIAKGADLGRMMAELLARDNGYCRGRGGSMHIADVAKGNLGANGIVAGGIPIAAGAALAHKLQGTDKVALSFFGDGATSEGAFHESVNLAAIWDLPVVFVCENNHYGMSMSVTEVSRLEKVADRAAGYGIPGVTVDKQYETEPKSKCHRDDLLAEPGITQPPRSGHPSRHVSTSRHWGPHRLHDSPTKASEQSQGRRPALPGRRLYRHRRRRPRRSARGARPRRCRPARPRVGQVKPRSAT